MVVCYVTCHVHMLVTCRAPPYARAHTLITVPHLGPRSGRVTARRRAQHRSFPLELQPLRTERVEKRGAHLVEPTQRIRLPRIAIRRRRARGRARG
eukprot:1971331-Prymnesium_polylepis.1